jgi:hypothetical protein
MEGKQAGGKFAGADHGRENNFIAVIDAIFGDWDVRRGGNW